ncbi:MAG: hypothetical protein AAF466_10060 [Bacteroidota bacterium]
MRNTIYLTALMVILTWNGYSQVGIGTTTPSSELEIVTTNTGIPALELNPQSGPTGSETGQLAVIGDKLFMYDDTRGKWLSTEATALNFGWAGSADGQVLWFGGDIETTGPIMPLDGTIVYVTINSTGGNTTKRMDLQINGTDVGNNSDATLDGRINLVGGSFNYSDFNIDFDAGDYLTIEAATNGTAVDDPTAIIWVKWRE